jgi:hypothetical protein
MNCVVMVFFILSFLLQTKVNCARQEPILFPGGILDPFSSIAYERNLEGGIDAVDLSNGSRIWHSDLGLEPLAVIKNGLVATINKNNNSLEIGILNTHAKGLIIRTFSLSFPAAVNPASPQFSLDAILHGETLLLYWQYVPSFSSGIAKRPEAPKQADESFSGIKEVSLAAGQIRDSQTNWQREKTVIPKPELERDARFLPYRRFLSWTTEPWVVDRRTMWLVASKSQQGEMVSLLATYPDRQTRFEQLVSGEKPFAFLTPDGCYALILKDSPEYKQPWHVFSVETGEQVGQITFEKGIDEPFVDVTSAYWLFTSTSEKGIANRFLVAADVRTGQVKWRYSLGTQAPDRRPVRPQ